MNNLASGLVAHAAGLARIGGLFVIGPAEGHIDGKACGLDEMKGISDNYMRMFFALWIMPPDERAEVLKQYAEEIQRRKREKENQTLRNPRRQSHFSIVKRWQVEACAV